MPTFTSCYKMYLFYIGFYKPLCVHHMRNILSEGQRKQKIFIDSSKTTKILLASFLYIYFLFYVFTLNRTLFVILWGCPDFFIKIQIFPRFLSLLNFILKICTQEGSSAKVLIRIVLRKCYTKSI